MQPNESSDDHASGGAPFALDSSGTPRTAGDSGGDGSAADTNAAMAPAAAATAPVSSASSFRKFRDLLIAKKFESYDKLPIQVLPDDGVFIGSFGAANNRLALQQLRISHILCASGSLPLQFPEAFVYLRLSIADLPDVKIAESFSTAFAFIDSALAGGGRVLVHCFLGKSRSAALVLAYLIARRRLPLRDATDLLKRVRPQIQPNSGFLRELEQFEKQQLPGRDS